MACRVYKYSFIISMEKQANCFHLYWITAHCWFIKFWFTFSNQKRLNLKSQIAEVLCSRLAKCRGRTVASTGRCKETGSDWQLSVLLAELFCKWWWGLSDKVGWAERRCANAVLSSEEIQFRSINIDMLLSPTKLALRPLVRQIHAGLIYTPPRHWYLGVKQQMARPLAPWVLPLFFSFSVTWLLFLFAFHGCCVCRRGDWRCLSELPALSHITKAPSHHLSKNKLPSPERHLQKGLFTVDLTEKLEDGKPKYVLISI